MAIATVVIGRYAIHLGAYNPRDDLADAFCRFAVAQAVKALRHATEADVREWARVSDPEARKLFEMLDHGWQPPVNAKPGEYPVHPQSAHTDAHIAGELQRQRARRAKR